MFNLFVTDEQIINIVVGELMIQFEKLIENKMRFILIVACVLFAFVLSLVKSSAASAQSIQIISPVNHSYVLHLDKLKHILEAAEIKDRQVVVVSIAGAFRQGKSFLLNFFIRYLNAQVKPNLQFLLKNLFCSKKLRFLLSFT